MAEHPLISAYIVEKQDKQPACERVFLENKSPYHATRDRCKRNIEACCSCNHDDRLRSLPNRLCVCPRISITYADRNMRFLEGVVDQKNNKCKPVIIDYRNSGNSSNGTSAAAITVSLTPISTCMYAAPCRHPLPCPGRRRSRWEPSQGHNPRYPAP